MIQSVGLFHVSQTFCTSLWLFPLQTLRQVALLSLAVYLAQTVCDLPALPCPYLVPSRTR